jgi:uncharacterized protein YecE (DUF72 family)
VEGWAEKTPPQFLIAAKFPKDIVHGGEERYPDPTKILDPDATYPIRDQFLENLKLLGPRLGPLVIQFPFFSDRVFPSAAPFLEKLDRFLRDLPKGISFAVEVRNRDWVKPPLVQLCREHRVALVLVDQAWMPHADEVEKAMDPISADFAYVRLLGDRQAIEEITTTWEREVLDHSDRLERWGRFLARLLAREIPTVVYVNNHYAGHAPATVERLRDWFERAAGEAAVGKGKNRTAPTVD